MCFKDTIKSPPQENKTMKKASVIAIIVTTFFYFGCGCFGYAAFGNSTPGNLLTGFGFYEPYWLIDFANACIILHLIGGYQVNTLTTQYSFYHFDFSSHVNDFPIPISKLTYESIYKYLDSSIIASFDLNS